MRKRAHIYRCHVVWQGDRTIFATLAAPKKGIRFVAIIFLVAAFVAPAQATRPILPNCEMLYPAMGKASLETVIAMLRTTTTRKSECLMRQLPKFGNDAVAPLTALLHDGPEQGRANAASGLAMLGEHALLALPDLELTLNDPSDRVRMMVLYTLAAIQPRSPALTRDLLQRLQQATPGTRECEALIQAIERMGSLPAEALPVLAHVLTHLPPYDKRAAETAIDAISHISAPQRVALLAQLVGDRNPGFAWRATLAIGRAGELAVPALLYHLADPFERHRQSYARALDWAWEVTTSPSLRAYYQADIVTLTRQLHASLSSDRARALQQLQSLAPAFSLEIPAPWQGDEELAMPFVRCQVLDALDTAASETNNETERRSMTSVAASMRQAQPHAHCPILIY
jgi:HEAT repeat protein